jgi:thiol-disulfide isomerase/thioredoxin
MMRVSFRSLCLLAVSVAAVGVHGLQGQTGVGQVSLPIGTQAPSVTMEDLSGKAVVLQDVIKGKPAVLEFWATWCEVCAALQPQIDRVQTTFGDKVQVIAIAVGVNQTVRRVQQHQQEHNMKYPVLWDGAGPTTRGGNAVRAFRATTTSIIVILDANGKVAYTGSGADQKVFEAVQRLVAGR